MPAFICTACGTQYAPSDAPLAECRICRDERQFIPPSGQSWTTLDALRAGHSNKYRRLAPGLMSIETTPAFGIGQRAILARTPGGTVLWDCIALIDDATIDILNGLGGVAAIAISHPHYYTTMVDWSRALGGVPIHLHAADRAWVTRTDPAVQFWDGDTKPVAPGLTLLRLGGHYDGGTVLHWADWDGGRGVVLSGDVLQVVPSGHVSFMWSYPNLLPLPPATVLRMAELLEPFPFDAVYGSFSGRGQIDAGGKQVVAASVARYVACITAPAAHLSPPSGVSLGQRAFALASKTSKRDHAMAKNAHHEAAEHHEAAAKSHRTAAEHHDKGDHAKGHEHATAAHGHSDKAHKSSTEAHGQSASHAKK